MATVAATKLTLARSRQRIDRLDREIVRLLNERAKAAQAAGTSKRKLGLPVRSAERERAVFRNIRSANVGPLPDRRLIEIYRQVIRLMQGLQKQTRVK